MLGVLVVDAGNSNIHFGLFMSGGLVGEFRLSSRHDWTVDELEMMVRPWLQSQQAGVPSIECVVLSCVVPPLVQVFQRLVTARFGARLLTVGPGIRTGLVIGADHPREIGPDRIVNLIAACERFGAPVIVVDLGTATTFSVADRDRRYLGGAIAPGVQTAVTGLVERAARLPQIEFSVPDRVIGKNTTSSMQSGALYGFASLVDGMVERMHAELGQTAQVVATGGFASLIVPLCRTEMVEDPELTLRGLYRLYLLNRSV